MRDMTITPLTYFVEAALSNNKISNADYNFLFNGKTNREGGDASKNRTDTIVVGQDILLPVCNYDQNNDKVSLTLQSNVTQKQVSAYDRRMYLDCIILKPKE